ncbi:MAG TPA: ABC transporter permease [Verrucomicrobiota bacterium]|nr:ABC transporter permease [Verrucomicrobiota bacterium]HNT15107.1 ABC transporter permease [Verrucomicrobiota bacterium]
MILDTLDIAVRALRRNLLRTLLTMLGIMIGVAAVIAMVAIGNGAKAQVENQIASLGQNMILVMSGNATRGGVSMGFGGANSLTKEDLAALRKEIPGISAVTPEIRTSAQVAAGNENISTSIIGANEEFTTIRNWPIKDGANFTEAEVRSSSKVALIGTTTAKTLFGDANPVGQIIRIKSAPFTIVGLLTSKGTSLMGNDQDDTIIVPYTSAMVRLTGDTKFRALNVQAESAAAMSEVQSQIADLLRQRHRIGADKDDDFIIRTQQQITEMATSTSKVMTMLLGAVAGVSLLVGGIGIMNIMLVSVTERTREIGVRMSIGARGSDILRQFLIEAVTLSLGGGLIGILLGIGSAALVSARFGWSTLVSTQSILMAFAFSALIGIFFGFYPARKAARLDPIDALRYE